MDLFTSSRPPISVDDIVGIVPLVGEDMRTSMSRPFAKDEVLLALQSMHPAKSPGPDGFPTMFYKKFWGLVGEEICSLVLNFLNHGGAVECHQCGANSKDKEAERYEGLTPY